MSIGRQNRMFILEGARIKETCCYDHVGIKVCLKEKHTLEPKRKLRKPETWLVWQHA